MLTDATPRSFKSSEDFLRESVKVDLHDHFKFAVGDRRRVLEGPIYGGARYPVEASIGARLFNRFYIDVGMDVSPADPVDIISKPGWLAQYGFGPVCYHVINSEQQFAEKLHASPSPGDQQGV